MDFGGFRKVPSQNTEGVRVMEASGKFLARMLRGLGFNEYCSLESSGFSHWKRLAVHFVTFGTIH